MITSGAAGRGRTEAAVVEAAIAQAARIHCADRQKSRLPKWRLFESPGWLTHAVPRCRKWPTWKSRVR
jgi:hypothetical protein